MMELMMGILMIGLGLFCIFIAGMICFELPALYGAELIMAGFCAFLIGMCGLICIAIVVDH